MTILLENGFGSDFSFRLLFSEQIVLEKFVLKFLKLLLKSEFVMSIGL